MIFSPSIFDNTHNRCGDMAWRFYPSGGCAYSPRLPQRFALFDLTRRPLAVAGEAFFSGAFGAQKNDFGCLLSYGFLGLLVGPQSATNICFVFCQLVFLRIAVGFPLIAVCETSKGLFRDVGNRLQERRFLFQGDNDRGQTRV